MKTGEVVKEPGTFPGDETNPEALRQILGLGLTTFGLGATGRSLLGLKDMFAKSFKRQRASVRPAVVEVNVPHVVEEDEEERPKPRRASLFKTGQRVYVPPGTDTSSASGPTLLDKAMGRTHSNIPSKPWYIPAATAAIGGGLFGGYKLVDTLLNKVHKQDKDKEMEEAKEEYRKALIEQYTPDSPAIKRGSAEGIQEDLDKLYMMYKKADFNDLAGKSVGTYGALAMLLAGGSGLATYNWVKSRSPEERLATSIRQRERLRWSTRPPEIYAVTKPSPVRVSSKEDRPKDTFNEATPETEEEIRKISSASKIASLYKP